MSKFNLQRKIYTLIGTATLMIGLVILFSITVYTQFQASHERWKQYTQQEVAISKSLTEINKNMGYGGFIHNLKNLVIRRDLNRYQDDIERNIFDLTEQLGILEGYVITEKDLKAIQQLDLTFSEYAQKYEIAKKMVLANATTDEIDAIVKVSDTEALAAMRALSSSINKRADNIDSMILQQNLDAMNSIKIVGLLMSIFMITLTLLLLKYLKGESKYNIQLQNEKEKAEYANKAKSQFLSSMSHELRTPLNAILGFSQILELNKDTLSENQNSAVQEILGGGHHLLHLISELLDLAKIESGTFECHIEEVSLKETITQCSKLINKLAEQSNIQIDYGNPQDYIIMADSLRIKQVLINYLSNAIKYNRPNGHVTISYQTVEGNRLRINVIDTGIGINESDLEMLFKPFMRVGDKATNIEGTGIGLIISKELMTLMNGTVGVSSIAGEGTTFWFEIKLSE